MIDKYSNNIITFTSNLNVSGKDFARVNKLLPLSSGFNNNYDQILNPTTFTSFTAVAFRSFHSYIQGYIE